jgi:predicted DNA-binding protein with PD1-like motif
VEYNVGHIGRVIAARLFEGEDLYESIESLARKEHIAAATVLITGGIRKANVVVGPKKEKPKIEPNFQPFTGPGEALGIGTLYPGPDGPSLHIHTGIGKKDSVVIGCPRGGAEIFLILEVMILEIEGIHGQRMLDKDKGLHLLRFPKASEPGFDE